MAQKFARPIGLISGSPLSYSLVRQATVSRNRKRRGYRTFIACICFLSGLRSLSAVDHQESLSTRTKLRRKFVLSLNKPGT
ncbi:hypothetical protein GYMLUDRAFT_48338 [Collybiopsis luxurians FD-317 M1]|uniref:Uncharacterized protein n=1 Tax=Collybiopsis luxurians FD-317 M1 TaxID=944289 RepID=A0A0D0CIZ9_9AGAR|nr:hypothetical protein GYMLUDRAFT_48338 [Collybiopsis luxurians FD-317 M1]